MIGETISHYKIFEKGVSPRSGPLSGRNAPTKNKLMHKIVGALFITPIIMIIIHE